MNGAFCLVLLSITLTYWNVKRILADSFPSSLITNILLIQKEGLYKFLFYCSVGKKKKKKGISHGVVSVHLVPKAWSSYRKKRDKESDRQLHKAVSPIPKKLGWLAFQDCLVLSANRLFYRTKSEHMHNT